MDFTFIIIALVLILVLILYGVQVLTLKWVKRRSLAAIRRRYGESDIILQSLTANFFGQTSKGYSQIRGNGALVLTKNELWFRMALPENELTIPVRNVAAAEIRKSHLRKSKIRPLFYVEFNTLEGLDSAAWLVEDPKQWCKEIEKLKGS